MLFLKWELVEVGEKELTIKQENDYNQKVYFTKEKVTNQDWLKVILATPKWKEVVIGVKTFAIPKKAWGAFVKLLLTGDIVK